MFDKIDCRRSIACGRIIWVDNGFSSKYFTLLMPAGWIIIALIVVIKNGHLTILSSLPKPFLISNPIACLIALLSLYFIRKNDRFEEINVNIPQDQLQKAMEPESTKLGWKVRRSNSKFMTMTRRKWYATESRAAVLFDGKLVLINVQNSIGTGGYFPFSFGRNKKLTGQLVNLINSVQPNPTQSITP